MFDDEKSYFKKIGYKIDFKIVYINDCLGEK